ncbi:MAG: 2OG-Fe dioxygenase family protein, partial [Nostoc sp.]
VFIKVLNPGELLLVNDHDFFHFTTPIKPQIDAQGSRDVFVLTSPSLLSE